MFVSFTVSNDAIMVVKDSLHNLQVNGFDRWCVTEDAGLREITSDIYDAILRVGTRAVVIFLVGRADVLRGRSLPEVMEKIIMACKQFGRRTHFIFGGPFPHPQDTSTVLRQLEEGWRILENRLYRERDFSFIRTAERFADRRGI